MNKLIDPQQWHGVWTALATPLSDQQIDRASLQKLIEKQLSDGVHGFVLAGSTGEGSLLSEAQYKDLLKVTKEIVKNRAPLVAGLGIGGTKSCLNNALIAKELGYDGVLASPPAYIKAPQHGLIEHFLSLAEMGGLPLCLYEVPGRAASSIKVESISTLLKDPRSKNICALKDASGDMDRAKEEATIFGDRLALLSGDDGTFADFLASGGHGCVSVLSHFGAKSLNLILETSKQKNFEEAKQIQKKLLGFIDALFWESNPIPVKTLLFKSKIFCSAEFCLPLLPMTETLALKLQELHKELNSWQK